MTDDITLSTRDERPTVDVVSAKGKREWYWWEFSALAGGGWKCVLWQPDKSYTIRCDAHGNLSCSCPAFEYNPHRHEDFCKHIHTVVKLRKLLASLQPQPIGAT